MEKSDEIIKNIFIKKTGNKDAYVIDSNKKVKSRKKNRNERRKADIVKEVTNGEDLFLLSAQKEHTEWGEITYTKDRKLPDNVLNWTNYHFHLYTRDLFNKKSSGEWILKPPSVYLRIQEVRDKFSIIFGGDSPIVFKKAIDYFFENFPKQIVNKEGHFHFNFLIRKEPLTSFCNRYTRKTFEEMEKQNLSDIFKNSVDRDRMISSLQVGDENFICDYGIVLSMNWFVHRDGMSGKEAAKRVYDVCDKLYKKGIFGVVKKSTIKWSPYPNWFVLCNDFSLFLEKISKDIQIKIEFEKSEQLTKKFNFLKESK